MAEETHLPVRERLLAAAAVFYERGIAATGIDSITKRAGVAKQSLYNHFASKAELVAAYFTGALIRNGWICMPSVCRR